MDNLKIENTIETLKRQRDSIQDPKLKEEINAKIKALSNRKEIMK